MKKVLAGVVRAFIGISLIALVPLNVERLLDFLPSFGTIYALGSRDVEFTFLLTDETTGKPVPGATVDIRVEGSSKKPDEQERVTLSADAAGRAKLFRKQVSCEDVVLRCGKPSHWWTAVGASLL